jgi:hypothetical protein
MLFLDYFVFYATKNPFLTTKPPKTLPKNHKKVRTQAYNEQKASNTRKRTKIEQESQEPREGSTEGKDTQKYKRAEQNLKQVLLGPFILLSHSHPPVTPVILFVAFRVLQKSSAFW